MVQILIIGNNPGNLECNFIFIKLAGKTFTGNIFAIFYHKLLTGTCLQKQRKVERFQSKTYTSIILSMTLDYDKLSLSLLSLNTSFSNYFHLIFYHTHISYEFALLPYMLCKLTKQISFLFSFQLWFTIIVRLYSYRIQKTEKPVSGTLFSYFKRSPKKGEKTSSEGEPSQEPSHKKTKFQ